MKNKKMILSAAAIVTLFAFISSVSAAWMGQWQGWWQWGGNKNEEKVMIDVNWNWIQDWQEDFDWDWILNKDDEDYEKTWDFENMKDDDWDWIPNKDDEDYEKPEAWNWEWNWNAEKMENKQWWENAWEKQWVWNWEWQGSENAAKNKNFTENAIKWKAYKKFDWELKEKKNFWDSSKIKNEDAVTYLQQRWIINWYDDWTFWPENSVNRAEATKIILEALWLDIENIDSTEFADVDANAWYAKYVEKAKDLWVVNWYEDWTFKPTRTVNKVELLKILFKAFEIDLTDYPVTELYADTENDAWFAQYLQYAKDNSLIDADENWNINPSQSMTRDEFSEVVYRLLQQQEAL